MSELTPVGNSTVLPIRRGGEVVSHGYGCPSCFNTGNVLCERTENPGPRWVFCCNCDAGSRRRNAYPRWHSGLLNEYTILQQQKYDSSGWRGRQ